MAITKRTFENWDGSAEEYIKEYFAARDAARAIKVKRLVIKTTWVNLDSSGDTHYTHSHQGETITSIHKAYTIELYT